MLLHLVAGVQIPFYCIPLSSVHAHLVTVEPASETVQAQECNAAAFTFVLNTTGTFNRRYRVTVECVGLGAGGKSALSLFTDLE